MGHGMGLAEPASGGRSPRHDHCHDRGPLHDARPRVLDARPPDTGLRPVRVPALPRNTHSCTRQPQTAASRVFAFEAIPFYAPPVENRPEPPLGV